MAAAKYSVMEVRVDKCVVIGCDRDAVVIVGKPTEWGAWEYWVCAYHKAIVDDGAEIYDQPDGRSIVLGDTNRRHPGRPLNFPTA